MPTKLDLDELYQAPDRLRDYGEKIAEIFNDHADKLESAIEAITPDSILSSVLSGVKGKMSPSPAGARRGIVHPTALDRDVIKWLFQNKGEQKVSDIRDAMNDAGHRGIDSLEVSKSLKFLCSTEQVGTNGKRGRGTAYFAVEGKTGELPENETNDAASGGLTARAAALCVLNELPMGDKTSPKKVFSRAMELFPDQFTPSSFGGLLSNLLKENLAGLGCEGEGRARVYYRTATLEGAAPMPEGAPPRTVTAEETQGEAATG